MCFRNVLVLKFFWIIGVSPFFSKLFRLTVPRNFVREPFCISEFFWYGKTFMDKREEGITTFRRKLFVSQCRKTLWRTLHCIRKFGVSKNFMHLKGGITIFRREFFVSHYRKNSWEALQCVRKNGVSKILCIIGGYHDSSSKILYPTVPKNFVKKPFCVSENFGYGKILCTRGVYHDFLSKFFSHNPEKFRRGTLLCFRKFLVSKNFIDKRGGGRGCHDSKLQKFLAR